MNPKSCLGCLLMGVFLALALMFCFYTILMDVVIGQLPFGAQIAAQWMFGGVAPYVDLEGDSGPTPPSQRPQTWPVQGNYPITAGYEDPEYLKEFNIPHKGVDIGVPEGTAVYSPIAGVARPWTEGPMGNAIIIESGDWAVIMGHLSSINIQRDQEVAPGQQIALSGGTPGTPGAGTLTTGPHLHYEVRYQWQPADPLNLPPSLGQGPSSATQSMFNINWGSENEDHILEWPAGDQTSRNSSPVTAGAQVVRGGEASQWRLVDYAYQNEEQSGGSHHIYVNVLDSSGNLVMGQPVVISWPGAQETIVTGGKPPGEYSTNFAMYGPLGSYTACMPGGSDCMTGMGLPGGLHVNWLLTFQKVGP